MGKRGPQPKPKLNQKKKPVLPGGAKKETVVRQIHRDYIEKHRGAYTLAGLAREVNLSKKLVQGVIDEIEALLPPSPPPPVKVVEDDGEARKTDKDGPLPVLSPEYGVAIMDEELGRRLNKLLGHGPFHDRVLDDTETDRSVQGAKNERAKREKRGGFAYKGGRKRR